MRKNRFPVLACAVLLLGIVLMGCNGGDSEKTPTPAPTGDNEIDMSDWFSDPTPSSEPASGETTPTSAGAEPTSPSEPLLTAAVTPDVSANITPQATPVGQLTEPLVTPGENTPTPTRRPDAELPPSPGADTEGSNGQSGPSATAGGSAQGASPTATPNPQDEGWLDGWY